MLSLRKAVLVPAVAALVAGCASPGPGNETGHSLTGAWVVSASRPGGQGVILLTFNSDGTFFRSGDTHPVLSVAHGAWKQASGREYDGNYVALRFDENRKLVGTQKTRIHITLGPGDDQFTGVAKVSVRDLDDREERSSETTLAGKRIRVDSF